MHGILPRSAAAIISVSISDRRSSHPATMTNQVLIVAARPAAKAPAEIVTSLRFTPVIAESEQEALDLLDRQPFRLIAVSGSSGWQRLRDAAERKQPMARVLELPEGNGADRTALRSLIVRHLDPAHRPPRFRHEERYRSMATILEAFTGSLELREVLRRIVALTRQEFGADRAWLLHPVNETVEFARPRFSDTAPDCKVGEEDAGIADGELGTSVVAAARRTERGRRGLRSPPGQAFRRAIADDADFATARR